MRRQDEAQPGGHWLASYPMTVSARVSWTSRCCVRASRQRAKCRREHHPFVPRSSVQACPESKSTRAHERRQRARRLPRGGGRRRALCLTSCDHRGRRLGLMRGGLLEDLPRHIGVDIDPEIVAPGRAARATRPPLPCGGARRTAGRRTPAARHELRPGRSTDRARARPSPWRSACSRGCGSRCARQSSGHPPGRAGHRAPRRVLRPAPGHAPLQNRARSPTPSRSPRGMSLKSWPGARCPRTRCPARRGRRLPLHRRRPMTARRRIRPPARPGSRRRARTT